MSTKPICFVIMGFGKKSDTNGHTYDLNKTYKKIIKPAVTNSGYQCIRADEVLDSGNIDRSMYALLIQADLVIADISTFSPNALYELGIRHAARPFSTIILKANQTKGAFDIDHTRMFTYSHGGSDIEESEVNRCKDDLKQLIIQVEKHKNVDSPLYEYIQNITPPVLPKEDYDRIIKEHIDKEESIFSLVEKALQSMKKGSNEDFDEAYKKWDKVSKLAPTEAYFIQQKALSKYKSNLPSKAVALVDALNIINELDPDGSTTDPETLGITGAIYKNLWLHAEEVSYLDRAIHYYGKCYKIRNDYYTGENYALCQDMLAAIQTDSAEKIYLTVSAKKTRQAIIEMLLPELEVDIESRPDAYWVYATLSQCYYGLNDIDNAKKYEDLFIADAPWEAKTFKETKQQLKKLLNY